MVRSWRMWMGVAAALALATPAVAQSDASSTTSIDVRFQAMVDDAKDSMLSDPSMAVDKARSAEKFVLANTALKNRRQAIAVTQWLQGEALIRFKDLERASPLIDHALSLATYSGRPTKLVGDLLISRGGLHEANPNPGAALSDYQGAYNIYVKVGDQRGQSIALLNIASLYFYATDYNNALKYFNQAADVYEGDPQLSLSISNNIANSYFELKRYAEGVAEYKLALSLARKMGSPQLEAKILSNFALGQLAAGDVDGAARSVSDAMSLAARSGGAIPASRFASIAANVALKKHRLAEAQRLIDQTFRGVDLTQTNLFFRESHQTAVEIYKQVGRSNDALAHLESLKRLDDEATKLAASANVALMSARFDYANQNLKIAKLKADELQRRIAYERDQARTQRFIFIGVVLVTFVGVFLLIFGLVTIRRSRNDVRAANIDLEATNGALEKALAAKTEFLATTSHEIRTPLNGILGMTQVILADAKLPPAMRDRIGVVHGAGVTMRALVDDILDVAKMETGNLTLEEAPVDLPATLNEVSRLWEEQARSRGLGFKLDVSACPPRIIGDAARLRQIVFNLLSNAMKFTSQGSVTLRADTSADGRLRLTVTDTGIGIPADKQEQIFESFRQVDAGTTRKYGGTGLGLSICRNLARAMDGEITVASVSGEGSSFSVTLPLRLAPDEVVAAASPDQPDALLLVETNPITRSMLRALLERHAPRIICAASLDEATEFARTGGVDRLLVDEGALGGDPDTAPDAISGLVEAADKAPIILLSASSDATRRARLINAGVAQVIAKPIGGAALIELLYPASVGGEDCGEPQFVSRAA